MREVEVKFRVRDLGALLAALKMRGIELGEPFCQDDQAYAPDGWAYGDDRRGVPFARLRTVDDRHVFTLKRPAENVLSCEEHETAVADRDQMHRAVIAMGALSRHWASTPSRPARPTTTWCAACRPPDPEVNSMGPDLPQTRRRDRRPTGETTAAPTRGRRTPSR